ncbi:MAG TPA: cytochrome c biogenesis protein CcsA [Syntrophomonadaceae bacterium]|nr:cytochrome c biogenesis protein CcsA [Syntrophomonadaceae bacterium]
MTLFNELLVFSTLALYGIAAVFYFFGQSKNTSLNQAALGLAIVGLFFNFLLLIIRTAMGGRLPLHNGYEFVLCFSFFTVLMYIIYEKWSENKSAGGIVMLINALLFLSIPLLMYNQINYIGTVMPALKSSWLAVHVITAIVAYSAFALAASVALLQLRDKTNKNDKNIFKIVAIGFATLTLSIVLGAIWAEQAWGRYWSWDPKETWALITWIIYVIYLHLHGRKDWRGRNANFLVVIGFIIVLFTFFGVNYLLAGLHSYA